LFCLACELRFFCFVDAILISSGWWGEEGRYGMEMDIQLVVGNQAGGFFFLQSGGMIWTDGGWDQGFWCDVM